MSVLETLRTAGGFAVEETVDARYDAPLPTIAPRTEDEWSSALALARDRGWTVLSIGGGTKRLWTPPAAADLALSTGAWSGVVAYEPADGTVTARSGTSMAALARTVAEGGHHLSPDVAHPDRATLGGVVAAGQSGLDRLRQGGIRDALLGARVLLADGSSSRSGGRLVKNVTGYDLHRLWCGSFGSLCVILEVSLRLSPSLQAPRVLRMACSDVATGLALARELRDEPTLRPVACIVSRISGHVDLTLWLGGLEPVVAAEEALLHSRLQGLETLDPDTAHAHRSGLRDAFNPQAAHVALRGLRGFAQSVETILANPAWDAWIQPGVGEAVLVGERSWTASSLASLRQDLAPGTELVVRDGHHAPHGTAPAPTRRLQSRVRRTFDPHGTFAAAPFFSGGDDA